MNIRRRKIKSSGIELDGEFVEYGMRRNPKHTCRRCICDELIYQVSRS